MISLLLTSGFSMAKEEEYRVILDLQYDSIAKDNETFVVEKNKKYGVMSSTGKTLMPLQSSLIYKYSEGLAQICKNNKYGFIDKSGKIVISPKWTYADNFCNGLAKVFMNYKYGFIDKQGKTVIDSQWDYAEYFTGDGVACVMMMNKKDKISWHEMIFYKGINGFGKWGLIDKTGKVLVSPQWDYMSPMIGNESLILVSSKNKYGIIDSEGKFLINPSLGAISYFTDGYNLSPVQQNGKWAFIDRKGKLVTGFEWNEEPKRMDGTNKLWMVVKKDTTPNSYYKFYGAVDDSGKVVIEPVHDQEFFFYDGVSKIAKRYESDNQVRYEYGYINDAGIIIYPIKSIWATDFSEDIAWVYGGRESQDVSKDYDGQPDYEMLRTCWRPIDKTGKYLKLTGWDKVTGFKNGYAAVSNEEGKSTIVDKNLNTVCELNYDVEACISGDLFIAYKNKKYCVVDKTGTIIYKPEWESYGYWGQDKNGIYLRKDSWGSGTGLMLLGKSQKPLGNTQWDAYRGVEDNLLEIRQEEKWGLINLSRETIAVPPQFDDMYYLGAENGESIWMASKNGKMGIIAVKIP